MKHELDEAIRSVFRTLDRNKYNISMGFFQKYNDKVESDPLHVRFADIKLHHKDEDGNDISGTVPLVVPGSKRTMVDFRLQNGDELLVFYTDRTLEQWKDKTGTSPQLLKNPVKDSINHGIAIPICSHHNSALITTAAFPAEVGSRMAVKTGDKAQIGTDTIDLLKILYDLITNMLVGTTVATPNTLVGTGVFTNAAAITTLQTKLAIITKTT